MKRLSQILKHAALLTAMLLTGSNAWAAYGLTGSSCMGLGNSFTAFTNNKYTFTASCSGSQWFRLYNGSISDANSCKLGSLSGGSTVSLGTSYSTTQPGSTYQYNLEITKGATYTFTMSGSTLTITTSAASYTVTPSGVGCTLSPAGAQSVTSGSSVTFTATPTASYVFSTATYSGTKSGDISKSGNAFTLTPTSSGTLTVTYVAPAASYTITTSGTNCSFNETSKSIVSGGSFDFVVTPNEGYKITNIAVTNATASPSGSVNYTTATTINVSNPTGNGTLTITTAAVSANRAPTVRIGAKPVIGADCGLTTTAYFAQRGCANITNVTLYYSNSRAFRIDGKNRTASKSKSVSNPAINTSTTVTLTSAEISEAVNPGETLYLRFTATNANGTSTYSDILPIKYECNKFITQNLAKSFTACPGKHEFTWSDMFIYPSPTTWSVKNSSNVDAKSEFSLVGDVMTWDPGSKASGTYIYTFTGKTDGYDDATATLTITYTAPSGSVTGTITGLTTSPATSAGSPTKPYTEITLNAAGSTGNFAEIDWDVTPATAEIYNKSGNTMPATAKFKAESRATQTSYTVTVSGYTSGCKSVSKTATIVVAPDVKETCN